MNYKKESLLKLLKLIEEISIQPGNEWFNNQIINLFVKNNSTNNNIDKTSLEARIRLIQQYLCVDVENLIDYSDFEDPAREQLFRDHLEMVRYKKGTPNHKICFSEFCKYAHLQSEEMINYFLNKISDFKIESIQDFVNKNNPNYNPSKKPTVIHHISYTYKLTAFKNAHGFSKSTNDTLWFINDFRNEMSHRNSLANNTDDIKLIEFENEGFLRSRVDFNTLSKKQKDILNEGHYIIKKRKENYNAVYEAIVELKGAILRAIHN
jgi:hypothetical protein